jgi:hypothetical protein
MVTRLRSRWLAGGGAILLVMSLSGMAAAATLVADTPDPLVTPEDPAAGTTDTTLTFEDLDGNGVDDDCQDVAPVALPDAVAATLIAVDLDGDGSVSTSEAAQSDWTGGANCNHGGYVSGVARGSDECDETDAPDADAPAGTTDEGSEDGEGDATLATTTGTVTASCDAETETETPDEAPAECTATAPAPVVDAPVDTSPNAHGKAVSEVAKSDAVGGKNCNHGGAVSAAAKKDHSGPHGNATKGGHGKGKGHGKP